MASGAELSSEFGICLSHKGSKGSFVCFIEMVEVRTSTRGHNRGRGYWMGAIGSDIDTVDLSVLEVTSVIQNLLWSLCVLEKEE